jgi:predicted HTH domain antitoxin
MAYTNLDLGEELGTLVAKIGQPIEQAAREIIVLELYRRSLISSGKAATLLGVPRLDFIQRAGELGIPYFRFTEDEWQAEVAESKRASEPTFPGCIRGRANALLEPVKSGAN